MIDWLAYVVATAVVGGVLAFIVAMFKIGPSKPDFSFGRLLAGCLLFVGAAPFLFIMGLTRVKGPALVPAITAWYDRSDALKGKIVARHVLWSTRDAATVLVIGEEPQQWGGLDRPAVRLNLERRPNGWSVVRETVMRSDRLDKDQFMFPPFP